MVINDGAHASCTKKLAIYDGPKKHMFDNKPYLIIFLNIELFFCVHCLAASFVANSTSESRFKVDDTMQVAMGPQLVHYLSTLCTLSWLDHNIMCFFK